MTTGEQLYDYPRDVIEAIGVYMPENSWVIAQPDRSGIGTPFYSVSQRLRSNANVINILLAGEEYAPLGIVDPNTLAVGLWLRGQRQVTPVALGLFSLLNSERYNPAHVIEVLNGDSNKHQAGHGNVEVFKTTGRNIGTISPILDRDKLQNFATVDFSAELLNELAKPHSAVAYPVGGKGNKHYVARAEHFLPAYAKFLAEENIHTNLHP